MPSLRVRYIITAAVPPAIGIDDETNVAIIPTARAQNVSTLMTNKLPYAVVFVVMSRLDPRRYRNLAAPTTDRGQLHPAGASVITTATS